MGRLFWFFMGGRAISVLGDGFGTIAMSLLVYELTGSKLAMGSMYLAALLPEVVLRLVGAPLVDRVNRVRLMTFIDLVMFVVCSGPFLLNAAGQLQLWHLFALQALKGAAMAFYRPAILSVVPSLVPQTKIVRANALVNGAVEGVRMIGPVLAGFVMTMVGGHTAMLLDAFTFAFSALMLLMLPVAVGAVAPRGSSNVRYLDELSAGFRFFGQAPALLLLCVMVGISNMCTWVIFPMHAPYVQEHLGGDAGVIGLLQGFWPFGYFLGAMLMSYLGDVQRRRPIVLGALVAVGVALAGLGMVPRGVVALALLCKTLEGASVAVFSSTVTAIFQQLVPNQLRGRVLSVQLLISLGANPLGAFFSAILAERLGITTTFIFAGIVPVVLGLAGFFIRSLRTVDGSLQPVEAAA